MTDAFDDIIRRCAMCGFEFVWTAGEQRYYADHDLQAPKRCKPCRALKRGQFRAAEHREVGDRASFAPARGRPAESDGIANSAHRPGGGASEP